MFLLKKILTPFLLPPGIFIVAVIAIGMVMFVRRLRGMGFLTITVGLVLWALSTLPVANGLIRNLEAEYAFDLIPSGDVIILLGGGINNHVADLYGQATPSAKTLRRSLAALHLYKRLQLPIIVTGGGVYEDNPIAEAAAVRELLTKLGVPADRIIPEDQARDTAQNALFSAAICRQHGFSQPIVLTSAHHLPRARLAFAVTGLAATYYPAYFLSSASRPFAWRHLLPRASHLSLSATALHEYLGFMYYRLIM